MRRVCLENGTWETIIRIVRRIVGLPKCTAKAEGGADARCWDNAYFDGGYFHNGKIVKTRVLHGRFFEQGNQFIRESVKRKKPFFAYISTNEPHGPFHCPQYLDMCKNQSGDCILWDDHQY